MMKNLWIVEDENEMAQNCSEFLAEGYHTRIFNDAESALVAFESGDHPDLIISDIRMAGMDGVTFISEVKSKKKDQKAILISGQSATEDLKRAIDLNLNGYLDKPFKLEALKSKIDHCFAKQAIGVSGDFDYVETLKEFRSVSKLLISMYLGRSIYAENLLDGAGIEWILDRVRYLKENTRENQLVRRLDQIDQKIEKFEKTSE